MKVAQNDETDSDMQPVHLPHTPSMLNLQHFTSRSSVRKRETSGILSRMSPSFAGTTYCRVRAHLAPLIVMSCFAMHFFALYLLFLPPLLSLDYETDAAACALTDYAVDDPSLPEQPGKPPPRPPHDG